MIRLVSYLMGALATASPAYAQDHLESVDTVIQQIAEQEVCHPDAADLRKVALSAVADWLDRHDPCLAPHLVSREDYERGVAYQRGQQVGLGIVVLMIPGYGVRITEVFPNTAAAEAGLGAGEVITAVEGQPLVNLGPETTRQLLDPGDQGTVVIDITGASGIPRRVHLQPRSYQVPATSVSSGEGYELVRVHHMGVGFGADMERFAAEHSRDGALVLDLRDTNTGSLGEALRGLGAFVARDTTVGFQMGEDGRTVPLTAKGGGSETANVAILVNQRTEGLAEFFAAALQRHVSKAVLVGASTAGVAGITTWVTIDDEHALRMEGSRLSLADASTWSGRGLLPDVYIPTPLPGSILPPPALLPDLQVDAAIRLVRYASGTSP